MAFLFYVPLRLPRKRYLLTIMNGITLAFYEKTPRGGIMCNREEDDGRLATYVAARERTAQAMPTYLFDMDGTLALMGDRTPYDWDRVSEDLPNAPVVHVAQRLQLFSTLIIVSGRDEVCRRQT